MNLSFLAFIFYAYLLQPEKIFNFSKLEIYGDITGILRAEK